MYKRNQMTIRDLYLENQITADQGFWRAVPLFAKPGDLISYEDDFFKFNAEDWTLTLQDLGAIAEVSKHGGAITLTTDTTDEDETIIEGVEDIIDIQAGKKAWFQCVITETAPATGGKAEWAIGLISDATTVVPVADAGAWATGDHDGVYFGKIEAGTNVIGRTSDATTQVETSLVAHVDGSSYTLGFKWDGVSQVEWFVGDQSYGKSTLSPTSLAPMKLFALAKTTASEAQVLEIDRITLIAER